jgi:hypothetical protein
MSKEGIATLQPVSMDLLCDPRTREEVLNDLWLEWVELALETELETALRRRFPGHSRNKRAHNLKARWLDALALSSAAVRSRAERLWRQIASRFPVGAAR